MKVKFSNINWDTSDYNLEVVEVAEELPAEVVLEMDDDDDVSLYGADVLSDEFGWCVISFDFEIL
jgi:hypothetical protein